MLILTRKVGESIEIGDGVKVTLFEIRGDRAKIGIEAPNDVEIRRPESPKPKRNARKEREPNDH